MQGLRHFAHNLVIVLALLLAMGAASHAQVVSIFNVDTTAFPDMQAEFIVLDAAGNPMRDFAPGDITVVDDGYRVDANFTIDCPSNDIPSPTYAVLVCDRSLSMALNVTPDLTRFDLLKRGVDAFINAVRFVPPTSVALTAFDTDPLLLHAFETSASPLIRAVDSMRLGGGTSYDPAFLDDLSGGIPLLEKRPPGVPRVLIFITDGIPQLAPDTTTIIARAKEARIAVYAITLGMPMTPELQSIARSTGGVAYGNVSDEDQMRAIYTSIALRSQGVRPCKLHWRSGPACGASSVQRTVTIYLKVKTNNGSAHYTAPARSVIQLLTAPAFLWFGPIASPDSSRLPLQIKPVGSAMRFVGASIPSNEPFEIVDWGGPPPPFTLQEGSTRTITVRFKPGDSAIHTTSLTLLGEPCSIPPITLSGGIPGYRDIEVLKLITPTGGEIFSGCDSVTIRWGGVEPTDPISIDYSADNGTTWRPVTAAATGLSYKWAPPGPGLGYRIRITSASSSLLDSITSVVGGGFSTTEGDYALNTMLVTPSSVVAVGNFLYFTEEGRHIVRQVDLNSNVVTTVAGTGSPGIGGDGGPATSARLLNPTGLAISGSLLYIADYGNNCIRRVDLATRIITTVAGTTVPGFSGDNGVGKNAQFNGPSRLAVGVDALFISDKKNNRVRRLDFKTNIITTVAGGGDFPGGDGSPAISVMLNGPDGLAFAIDSNRVADSLFITEEGGNRVRRVDMRSGIIVTIAGTGIAGFTGDGKAGPDAQLNGPLGVTVLGDRIYISDTKNNRIRSVNRATGIIQTVAGSGVAGFDGDNGPARNAKLNFPLELSGNKATLYVADALNDRIRAISIGAIGRRDSSQSSFTVAVAHVAVSVPGKALSFGAMALGGARDTALVGAICNTGNIPFTLDSATIVGAQASDFQIVSGISSATIPPGSCLPIELRFRPSAIGTRSAKVIVFGSCAGADTLLVSGIGTQPCGVTISGRVDFGSLAVGSSKDTTVTAVLCNTGTTTLTGKVSLVPADGAFSIASGGGTFALAPGACLTITARFVAGSKGESAALLDFGIPTACGPARTTLIGRGLTPPTLATALDIAYPPACWNGPRDTTLVITNSGDAPLSITNIGIVNNNEGFSILSSLPSIAAPLVIAPNASDVIAIRFNPMYTGSKSATIRITSNSAGSPTDVSVTGRRDSIAVLIDPAILSFDGRLAPTAYPLDSVISIRNTGSVSITFASGNITGVDGPSFAILPGQFPLTVPPGDSAKLRVRLLAPTTGVPFSAFLRMELAESCDSTTRSVRLLASGALPALVAAPPVFRPLICPDETERDTSVTITNPGGSMLVISVIAFRSTGLSAFSMTIAPPIAVPAGGSFTLPIRFAPPGTGTFAADLELKSNAAFGDSVIHLSGTREQASFVVTNNLLDFGTNTFNAQAHRRDTVINTGTVALSLALANVSASFAPGTPSPLVVQPGASMPFEVIFNANSAGTYTDTLMVTDERCSISRTVALHGQASEQVRTVVRLPVDSSMRNVIVDLPIRVELPNRQAFESSGAHGFVMSVSFDGALLEPVEAVDGAQISASTYDNHTARQNVILTGTYTAGSNDVLCVLRCRVLSSERTQTDLVFEKFDWDRPDVIADTINGLYSTTWACAAGVQLVSQVRIAKLRPQPVDGTESHMEAELDLQSDQELQGVVMDGLGHEIRQVLRGRYGAGHQQVEFDVKGLTSGTYWLVIRTPLGSDTAPIIITR